MSICAAGDALSLTPCPPKNPKSVRCPYPNPPGSANDYNYCDSTLTGKDCQLCPGVTAGHTVPCPCSNCGGAPVPPTPPTPPPSGDCPPKNPRQVLCPTSVLGGDAYCDSTLTGKDCQFCPPITQGGAPVPCPCSDCGGGVPVPPTPPPSGAAPRLTVENKCAQDLWITLNPAFQAYRGNKQNVRLPKGGAPVTYGVNPGTQSASFFVKTGCDSGGNNCETGQSLPPCPLGGCQPPNATVFEATYDKAPNAAVNYDLSFVGGYTVPAAVTPHKSSCSAIECGNVERGLCPTAENLTSGGKYSSYTDQDGTKWDLSKVDLRVYDKQHGKVLGCLSPCEKLTAAPPWGLHMKSSAPEALMYCCPNPPVSSAQCNAGPVSDTSYVKMLHEKCPTAYAFSFDDAGGGHTCSGTDQDLTVTFCPV